MEKISWTMLNKILPIKSWGSYWIQQEIIPKFVEFFAVLGTGLLFGAILVFTRLIPSDWAGIVIVAVIAPVIALLTNNMEKLLLIILVIDIPLGLDIALANRPGHRGGPAGFLISLMTIALVVGYARWLVKPSKPKVYYHKGIAIPALIFLFITLVSAFQATEVWYTLTEFFLTLQFVLMYFYLVNHVNSWTTVRLIVTTLAIGLILESLLMISQYYFGLDISALGIKTSAWGSAGATWRVAGTFGSPNPAATFLAASIVIIFAALLTNNRLVNKKLALVAMLLGVVALVMTMSRAAWFAITVSFLLITWQAIRQRLGIKVILLIFVVALILGAGFSDLIIKRFVTDDNRSAQSRIWYSKLAINIIKERMFTGVGANNQRFAIDDNDYVPTEMAGIKLTTIHNTYLAIWVELGLFGFLVFIWLLAAGGWRALYESHRTTNAYISIIITGVLGALNVIVLHMSVATFVGRRTQFLWFILALISVMGRLSNQKQGLEYPILQSKQSNIG